jgi:adiponectin receptor
MKQASEPPRSDIAALAVNLDSDAASDGSANLRKRSLRRRSSASATVTDSLISAATSLEENIEDAFRRLVHWDDLPAWRRDNAYIRTGYRPDSASYARSLASLGYLHNESVNIWSHLVGALAFLAGGALLHAVVAPRYESASAADVLVFACFFAGAVACMGMSATFHAISNHSPIVAKWGNKLDYSGIIFLIVGSYVPALYYGFYCQPVLMGVYLYAVSLPNPPEERLASYDD